MLNKLFYWLIFCLIFSFISGNIYYFGFTDINIKNINIKIFNFIIINALILSCIFKSTYKKYSKSLMQSKIILTFLLIALIPSSIIASLSIYFYYKNTKMWIDNKIVQSLEDSSSMISLYMQNIKFQMRQMSLSLLEILNEQEQFYKENSDVYLEILNTLADMRSLDEIIIFDGKTKSILAQSTLGFALSVINISTEALKEADAGKIVDLNPSYLEYHNNVKNKQQDLFKVRIMIKMQNNSDKYLIIGKLLEKKMIDYYFNSKNILNEYLEFRNNINYLQLQFTGIFILISVLVVAVSINLGKYFTQDIISRLQKLLLITKKLKKGNVDIKELDLIDDKNDELSELNNAFTEMIKQLEFQREELLVAQRAIAWSDVARKVAHEINNPLTPIQLATEMIFLNHKDEVKNKLKFEQYINSILRHVDNIKVILKSFVNFVKLPEAKLKQNNLYQIVNDLIASRKIIFQKINYKINSYSRNINFLCDSGQISQLLLNLIKNAEESIESSNVRSKKIIVNLSLRNDFLIMDIIDSGKGFDDQLLLNATVSYFTTKEQGTGLGLSISQKIITEHCGVIKLKNHDKGGGQVEITFDLIKLNNLAC